MARPLRIIETGLTYHVYTRCRNCNNYFKNKFYKNIVINVVKEMQMKLSFELNDFVIMPNHIHLVIVTLNDKDNISRIMQQIKSIIAKRMNKLLHLRGPFWNERFGSKIVYFFPSLCSYIANNPVRWGLVEKAVDYDYGTYEFYRNGIEATKLKITLHRHFLNLGNSLKECYKSQMQLDEYFLI